MLYDLIAIIILWVLNLTPLWANIVITSLLVLKISLHVLRVVLDTIKESKNI